MFEDMRYADCWFINSELMDSAVTRAWGNLLTHVLSPQNTAQPPSAEELQTAAQHYAWVPFWRAKSHNMVSVNKPQEGHMFTAWELK